MIKRFLEETNILKDKNVLLLMIYGSRVTNNNADNSDLDVLIVTSESSSYREARLIDGILIDVISSSIDEVQREIIMAKLTGSSYFESVLKTGKIIIDRYDTYDNLCDLLNFQKKGKRILNPDLFELAKDHTMNFFLDNLNNDVDYFSALEFLRRLYQAKNNCTNIHVTKVFDLYTNKSKAKKIYKAKLPDDKFINNYLLALREVNYERRRDILNSFFSYFKDERIKEGAIDSFLDKRTIRKKLIVLNNAIIKCEAMLLNNHPYSKALYFILIGEIKSFYKQIYGYESDDLLNYYNWALNVNETEEKIKGLEILFCLTDREYRIDYNDFIIKV